MDLGLWAIVLIAGAMGQFLDAMAGMGFGVLSSSVMVAAQVAPAVVVATVNLAKLGSGLLSGIAHWRFGNVRWAWVAPLAIPGIAGGAVGVVLLTRLPDQVVRLWMTSILLLMGALLLRRFLFATAEVPRVAGASENPSLAASPQVWRRVWFAVTNLPWSLRLGGIGFVAGVVNGLSGAYGPFATTAVILAKGEHPRYAVGTVNLVEFFVVGATSITLLWQLGRTAFQFPWQLPLALVLGALVTVPLGASLARHLPARVVGITVGVVLLGINLWSIVRLVAS